MRKTKISRQNKKIQNNVIKKVPDKKVVCFACFSPPNVFNSYILSKTVYKDDYTILILSDWNCEDIYRRLLNKRIRLNVWDKVILIKEAKIKGHNERFLKIKQQLSNLNIENADIVHYFQINQNSYLSIIFDYIPTKTKIIQTVFTASSYYIKEYYIYLKKLLNTKNIKINIDYNRLSEIWLYDKRLYIDRLLRKPLKDIDIKKYFSNTKLLKEFCIELNKLFGYTHQPMKYDVLFFDQPLNKILDEEKEKSIFNIILNEFQGKNMLIKNHPRSSFKNKYKNFNVKILRENKTPWEVIFLNELLANNLKNKIFVSYFSDTLTTTHIFLNKLGIDHYAIRLKKIIDIYSKVPIGDPKFENFNRRFKVFYGQNFYDIKTIKELKVIIKNINHN